MSDNIIQFPKFGPGPSSPEELAEMLQDYKEDFANEISEMLWNHVIGELHRAGCDFHTDIERYFPSMLLVLESIRSLHLQSQGAYHPLQEVAKESVNPDDLKKMVDISEDLD